MELFPDVPGATLQELDKCTQVRLYLRVITIADIAHESGGVYSGPHTHQRVAIGVGYGMATPAMRSEGLLSNVPLIPTSYGMLLD